MPNPESLRETGVAGKLEEAGEDDVGEGGERVDEVLLPRLVELVDGLMDGRLSRFTDDSQRFCTKALYTAPFWEARIGSENAVEDMLT